MLKMDLDTAKYLVGFFDGEGDNVRLSECEKCKGLYVEKLGHNCNNTVDIVTEEDKEGFEIIK